jgi:lysophospholipase L1-like esterase
LNFKISKILILISFFVTIISSCKKDNEQENDSYESYRYELWKNLVDNNYNFDFTGRQKDYGTYEEYSGLEFDIDHEGVGGYETEDVLENIEEILATISSPDIVLLSIGGNDLLDGGNSPSEPISNIVELVGILQTHNSNITIFLERIAPANNETMTSSLTTNLNEFNSQIVSIANTLTTNTSKVIALDMNTNFNESYLADEVHYNEAGAKFVADIYFGGIQSEYTPSSSSINILPLGSSRVEGNRP